MSINESGVTAASLSAEMASVVVLGTVAANLAELVCDRMGVDIDSEAAQEVHAGIACAMSFGYNEGCLVGGDEVRRERWLVGLN